MSSNSMILQFLEAGLVNVGSDDSKLEKLIASAGDLANALRKVPAQTVRWTLVATDPEVPADDPVIVEAWTALRKNWPTVSNTYQSVPVALLRAALLDALVQTAAKDETVAVAFANSARNMLPHMPLGDEAPVWEDAVAQVEDRVDVRAEAEWRTPEQIEIGPMVYEAPGDISISSPNKVTNRKVLVKSVYAATGPQSGETNTNPYYASNNVQQWGREFADRMGDAVADAIDAVATANRIAPVDLSPPLEALATTVSGYVADALAAFSGATAGLQRRTNLLWWKEALYSASSRRSYRAMEPFTAASLMAFDLLDQVPVFSPASVSAFLNEAILLVPRAAQAEPASAAEIVDQLVKDPLTASLRDRARKLEPTSEGRVPVLAVIGHVANPLAATDFRRATGLDGTVLMRPDVWGAHLFRELQAARALTVARRPRGRG